MKVFALKDLPDGTPAGRVVDYHEDAVAILTQFGIVRPATDDEQAAKKPILRRGPYLRRDLRAS